MNKKVKALVYFQYLKDITTKQLQCFQKLLGSFESIAKNDYWWIRRLKH